jgi:DNA-binding beta-propeller fold protein YncE
VIAATAGAALAVGTGTHPPQLLPGPSLLLLETTSGDLRAAVRLPTEPAEVAVFGNLAWVTSREQSTVAAIDLAAAEVTSVIGLPQPPTALTAVGDVATVGLAYSGELVRTAGARAEPPQTAIPGRSGRLALATDGQAVWVATVDGFIAPQGTGDAPLRVEGAPRRLAVDSQRVWALTFDRSELVSVHRRTDALVRSSLRGTPVDVSSDQGSAFAVTSVDNRLWRADPASGRVVATRALPGPPTAVAAADGRVWVSIRSPAMLISYDGGSLQPGPAVELPTQPADMDITGEHMVVVLR